MEHIPKYSIHIPIIKFIGRNNVIANIFRVQANDSMMCGYFCIEFINFMLNGKSLNECTNLFSPYDFKRNDNIILNYFIRKTYL